MKKAVKVLLINVAVVLGISVLLFLSSGGFHQANDFLIGSGLICLAAAILNLFVAVILFFTGQTQYEIAKGFLLSSGVLFLVGFAACSSASINLH